MKVLIAEDATDAAVKAADIMEKIIREEPGCTIGLATGSSPVGMYKELARRCKEDGLDFSKIHSVNLDEYVGLEGTHEQSYRYFMDTNLFDHIKILQLPVLDNQLFVCTGNVLAENQILNADVSYGIFSIL